MANDNQPGYVETDPFDMAWKAMEAARRSAQEAKKPLPPERALKSEEKYDYPGFTMPGGRNSFHWSNNGPS